MNRIANFNNRNLKEILRDPIVYVFCLGFPIIMIILFQIINNYTSGNTPIFNLESLLPAIIMFSYTFVMLSMAILVSKDRQTFFLKRLYSSPMKASDFILGYFSVGFIIGVFQTIVCVLTGFIVSLIINVSFLSFTQILLLIISQLPILIANIFLGILFGTIFNDKSAPGVCSIFISLSGMLGGCWMPVESMGNFELFCRCLPFYPSVYIGRVISSELYVFNSIAKWGIITVLFYTIIIIFLSFVAFKKTIVSDK